MSKDLKKRREKVMITIIMIFVATGFYLKARYDHQHSAYGQMNNPLAQAAVRQYEMVARSGTKIEKCVQAGIVKATYLQLKDQKDYEAWAITEDLDCMNAGVPR